METNATAFLPAFKFLCGESAHICRLCFACTENEEYNIEDSVRLQKPYFDDSITFLDMFDELGVTTDAGLPEVVCMDCAATTINSYLFRKLCHSSDRQWREALSKLEDSLVETELSQDVQTAYLLIKKENYVIYTSKKKVIQRNKTNALSRIKRFITNQSRHKMKRNVVVGDSLNNECLGRSKKKVISTYSENARIPCPQCSKYFPTDIKLKDHTERIHLPKTIQCTKCAQMFSTMKLLKTHEKIHHVAALCKLCFVQFPSKNALRAHLDKHDVLKCESCSKTFIHKQTYKLHLKICGNPDRRKLHYFCDICGKGYSKKNSIRTHLKTVHGFGRVYSCSWCSKKFDAVSRLRNHVVKHTKERNFYCEHCGGKFVTQAALVYHIRLHTGEKPYKCDLCEESFLSTSRRMAHKRRKHFEPTNECSICNSKFVTRYQLVKHEKRHYDPQSKLYTKNDKYNICYPFQRNSV